MLQKHTASGFDVLHILLRAGLKLAGQLFFIFHQGSAIFSCDDFMVFKVLK